MTIHISDFQLGWMLGGATVLLALAIYRAVRDR